MSDSNRKAREWWLNVAPKQKAFGHTTRKAALLAKSFPSVEVVHVLEATPARLCAEELLEALELIADYTDGSHDAQILMDMAKSALHKARGGKR